jgi:hypothetical protein
MTLLFDLSRLERAAGTSAEYLRELLLYYYSGKPPSRKIKRAHLGINLRGKSYLLNPLPVLTDRATDPIYISQYIKLAARRSYTMYLFYKLTFLDLAYYPDIDVSKIQHNPLLTIANNKIYFKHEDN